METPPPPAPDDTQLRAAAVKRLLNLKQQQQLTRDHLKVVAQAFGRDIRTIERWIENAEAHGGTYTPDRRRHFTLTRSMRDTIARKRGNATDAWRELSQELPGQIPSLATFHRAAARDIKPGQRAGMRHGERVRRHYDIAGKRPRPPRNNTWETDHVEASVKILIDGHPRKPWITWFVDAGTSVILGLVVTPHRPSREAVLAAIRASVLRDDTHGPFGGLPTRILVDGGKEFLCTSVGEALGVFGVERVVLIDNPEGKPCVEAVNGAVKKTLFADMPGYTHAPTLAAGKPVAPDQPLLPFEAFMTRLLEWVRTWNFDHTLSSLQGRTPAQAWNDDLTPIEDIDPQALHTYTLERLGKPLTINNTGVRWRRRDYIADWMHGLAGEKVHLRYMPHHNDNVELYDPETGRHLGTAHLAEKATPEQRRALKLAQRREADGLRAQLIRVERERNIRYAAATQPTPPQPLDDLTEAEARTKLRELGHTEDPALPLPDYIPLPKPSSHWVLPEQADQRDSDGDASRPDKADTP